MVKLGKAPLHVEEHRAPKIAVVEDAISFYRGSHEVDAPTSNLLYRFISGDPAGEYALSGKDYASFLFKVTEISRASQGLNNHECRFSVGISDSAACCQRMKEWAAEQGCVVASNAIGCCGFKLASESHIEFAFHYDSRDTLALITLVGDEAIVQQHMDSLKARFDSVVDKNYLTIIDAKGKASKYVAEFEASELSQQAFYPWLTVSMDDYFKAFLASDEAVLLIYGPPGNGKSTFLRTFIDQLDGDSLLSYNLSEQADAGNVEAFRESYYKTLIYEDCDVFLGKRENGNPLMSTFLNMSNGIKRYPQKKMIFSTNLQSIENIDPALLRVGRCFDILHFRNLTQEEAVAARRSIGLPVKDFSTKKDWTLSEALMKESPARQMVNRLGRKVGF